MNHRILILALSLITIETFAQSVVGKWKTIDDNTGKARSIVEIYEKDARYFGKIVKIYFEPGDDTDPICDLCSDDRKDQKIIGMEIIRDMKFNAKTNELSGGEILDPEEGKLYDCKIWTDEDGSLNVRGYLYFFFRTQTWLKFDE
ncbi:MAG: DUF2147 domain-containing protein [Cyclobacteriaceae bacterium]